MIMKLRSSLLILLLIGGFPSNCSESDESDPPEVSSSFEEGEKFLNGTEEIHKVLMNESLTDGEKFPNGTEEMYKVLMNESLTDDGNFTCNKSFRDLIEFLKLGQKNDLSAMTRPAKDPTKPTDVNLDVLLYAILDVKELEQTFISYVWIDMMWTDDYISWNPNDFCDISDIVIPTKYLWKPDLTIEEMTEKDKATESPFLSLSSSGGILLRNDMVLITTCKMHVYKFPFDIQRCNISFKSVIHTDKQLTLSQLGDSSRTTRWANKAMRTQSDWLFISITFANYSDDNFYLRQSVVVYTVTMKRRPVLYVANFILPVLMFLTLDLASFLISDRGGEKLGFKVTVLLAVTVMQLILNEILPSSSDRIPLIALFCIGVFGLMMLSLLETILVLYLIRKDSACQGDEKEKDQSLSEDCEDKRCKISFQDCVRARKVIPCVSSCDMFPAETSSELLQAAKEANSSQVTAEESPDFEKEVLKTLALLLSSRKEEDEPGYWTKMTKKINKVFLAFYFSLASLFLSYIIYCWHEVEDE